MFMCVKFPQNMLRCVSVKYITNFLHRSKFYPFPNRSKHKRPADKFQNYCDFPASLDKSRCVTRGETRSFAINNIQTVINILCCDMLGLFTNCL